MQFMASRVLAFSRVLPSRASEYGAVAHALVGPKSGHRSGAAGGITLRALRSFLRVSARGEY